MRKEFNDLPNITFKGNVAIFEKPYRCNLADFSFSHKGCLIAYEELEVGSLVGNVIAYSTNEQYNSEIYAYKSSVQGTNIKVLKPVIGGSVSIYE